MFAAHCAENGKTYRFASNARVSATIGNERDRRLLRNAAVRDCIEELYGSPLTSAANVRHPRLPQAALSSAHDTNQAATDAAKAIALMLASRRPERDAAAIAVALAVAAASAAIGAWHRHHSSHLLRKFAGVLTADLCDAARSEAVP